MISNLFAKTEHIKINYQFLTLPIIVNFFFNFDSFTINASPFQSSVFRSLSGKFILQ